MSEFITEHYYVLRNKMNGKFIRYSFEDYEYYESDSISPIRQYATEEEAYKAKNSLNNEYPLITAIVCYVETTTQLYNLR